MLALIEEGKLDFEVQEVAQRSGVHRTTIFRRWPDRGALIAEALREHVSRLRFTATGDWRADLRGLAFAMRDFLSDPAELAMNRLLVRDGGAHFHDQMMAEWRASMAGFEQSIDAARARGELSPDVAADLVVGPILATVFYLVVIAGTTPTDAFLDRLIAQSIRGCQPPA